VVRAANEVVTIVKEPELLKKKSGVVDRLGIIEEGNQR
jgi:hypothetical protein